MRKLHKTAYEHKYCNLSMATIKFCRMQQGKISKLNVRLKYEGQYFIPNSRGKT